MAFNISVYVNKSEKNMVTKELTGAINLPGMLREGTSIVNPTIRVQGDISTYAGYNYMWIPAFKRYYFITDMVSQANQLIDITAHVDVLMSFKDTFLKNKAIIKRQENDWNLYLNDGTFMVYQDPGKATKLFPSGFNTYRYILIIAGS